MSGSGDELNFNKLMSHYWTKKRWINLSTFCNGKNHPSYTGYRKYRRGTNRCHSCGAKIGKIRCERKSSREVLVDNIYNSNSIIKMFADHGRLSHQPH